MRCYAADLAAGRPLRDPRPRRSTPEGARTTSYDTQQPARELLKSRTWAWIKGVALRPSLPSIGPSSVASKAFKSLF